MDTLRVLYFLTLLLMFWDGCKILGLPQILGETMHASHGFNDEGRTHGLVNRKEQLMVAGFCTLDTINQARFHV